MDFETLFSRYFWDVLLPRVDSGEEWKYVKGCHLKPYAIRATIFTFGVDSAGLNAPGKQTIHQSQQQASSGPISTEQVVGVVSVVCRHRLARLFIGRLICCCCRVLAASVTMLTFIHTRSWLWRHRTDGVCVGGLGFTWRPHEGEQCTDFRSHEKLSQWFSVTPRTTSSVESLCGPKAPNLSLNVWSFSSTLCFFYYMTQNVVLVPPPWRSFFILWEKTNKLLHYFLASSFKAICFLQSVLMSSWWCFHSKMFVNQRWTVPHVLQLLFLISSLQVLEAWHCERGQGKDKATFMYHCHFCDVTILCTSVSNQPDACVQVHLPTGQQLQSSLFSRSFPLNQRGGSNQPLNPQSTSLLSVPQ